MLGKKYGYLQVFPKAPEERRPDREVVLLLHGLGGNQYDWTWPEWRAYNYDHLKYPDSDWSYGKLYPPIDHLPDFSLSPKKPVGCWRKFLSSLGHTVIVYSQDGPEKKIEAAYKQLKDLIVPYIKSEVLIGNLAEKKITVIAHSRGGLLIRLYLTRDDSDEASNWLSKVVTLHSPHTGSQMAAIHQIDAFNLPAALVGGATVIHGKIMARLLQQFASNEGARQLAPDNELFDELDPNTNPASGVEFHTFEGTSVTLTRLYSWHWSPFSYIPRITSRPPFYAFDWELVPIEIPFVSPLFDSIPDIADEVRPGKGDILVAGNRSKLSFATSHRVNALNHAEALTDRNLFQEVARLLGTSAEGADYSSCAPAYVGNRRTKEVHDLRNQSGSCQIAEIRSFETFDSFRDAKNAGYDGCYWCMGSHESKR